MKLPMGRLGWGLFFVGSLVFLADAVRLHDDISIIGSALFVFGVIAFVVGECSPGRCVGCDEPLRHELAAASLCTHCRAELTPEAKQTIVRPTRMGGPPARANGEGHVAARSVRGGRRS